ncbi:MAG: hypothetical protein HQ510_00440 [Candidatus Marinimicrobia bacterium]|nr:hypothetical protein [Candidatus Neomarinimicrobiota bacterium]
MNSLEEDNIFAHRLHFERISMLTKATLSSNARNYKTDIIRSRSLPKLFNYLSEATFFDFPDGDSVDSNLILLTVISKIANAQFPYQRSRISTDMARAYLLYDLIPKQEENYLKNRYKTNYVNIPKVFENQNGITVKDYLIITFVIFAFYMILYNKYIKLKSDFVNSVVAKIQKLEEPNDFIFEILFRLIEYLVPFRNKFIFNSSSLILADSDVLNEEMINKYLALTSRTPTHLSDLQNKATYKKGSISLRLCPLERYPILKFENDQYLVPNIRYFDASIEKFIHFEMQDLFPSNQFNDTFGGVFEKYVQFLTSSRLDGFIFIPEISYQKNNVQAGGIDLVIIDEANNAMIGIEVKSKKVSLDTKLSPMSDSLDQDMQRIYEAFKKLPSKIDDLYAELPEYTKWQKIINKIPRENIYCLVVISGSLFYLPELINQFRIKDESHILNNYRYKYGIMSIDNYEHLIELVYHKKNNLPALLHHYWKSSIDISPKKHSSQLFGGAILEETTDYFLHQYIDDIFVEVDRFARRSI